MADLLEQKTSGPVTFDRPLLHSPGQDIWGYVLARLGSVLLFLLTSLSVVMVLLIFVFIVQQAIPFFRTPGIKEFFISTRWYPEHEGNPEYGGLALLVGSAYVTATALLFAVPLGVLAAVFLSDIVSFRVRQLVKPVIEILAAIPSVAYGFFALVVVAPWMQAHLGLSTGTNALNAGIILAIMAAPTIISIAEDALTAQGRELREGSYALGATRAETIVKVLIPAAHNGILAAVLLGMMRAIGETMVVWMASGNASQIPAPWWDLSQAVRTMTATIAGEMGETAATALHRNALFAIGLLLLVFTLVLNLVSEHFMARKKRK